MQERYVVEQNVAVHARINRAFARLCTFLLTAVASLTLTLSAYLEVLHAPRVGALLVVLIALHALWHLRLLWQREFTLYACLLGYMFITLLWTRNVELAINTLAPAINFILVMIFFGSLIKYHNVPTVFAGALCGFVAGAAIYTLTQGFPFSYPKEFSYNAIANMYLFGLFVTLACSCLWRSSGFFLIAIAVFIMLHIVATTSIKANLGVALGLLAAGIMYFRHFGRLFRRRVLTLIILASGLGFAIASNEALLDAMNRGAQRVSLGVHVLQSRGNVAGYSAFEDRDYWKKVGIEGWKLNPVFGYGTEAFRNDYGITSHSTVIDLLYNFGLIGLILFYSIFASLIWRLLPITTKRLSSQRSLILGGVVCYVFVSLSGTVHYNIFLAAFIGISSALLGFHGSANTSTLASGTQRVEPQ
jgi:hypothetical protein